MDQSTRSLPGRHPAESYEDILNRDSRPVPDRLRQGPIVDFGQEGVPVTNYSDPQHFANEVRHVWLKVWQWACREEDIPAYGDVFVYENVEKSVVVARQSDGSIKAFHNSCLHRGRTLVDQSGHQPSLTCKYHGMSWKCSGEFRHNPMAWDFAQFQGRDMSLPELKVGVWGGFVFVNFDPDAKPLLETLGPLVEHFVGYDYANRYTVAHVSKVVPCNWKVMAEAFMEGHHIFMLHPQALPFMADMNSQHDILSDFVSRHCTAAGVASPMVESRKLSEPAIFEAMINIGNRMGKPSTDQSASDNQKTAATAPSVLTLAEGATARAHAAEMTRQSLSAEDGWDYAEISDAEILDPMLYNVFPHQCFWGGYSQSVVYRWRPNGLDPATSVMDVLFLKRVPKDGTRPKPAIEQRLGPDEAWSDAANLGTLGLVIDQDMTNIPHVQRGLRSSGTGVVNFSLYSEMRIRHMHDKIRRMILEGQAHK